MWLPVDRCHSTHNIKSFNIIQILTQLYSLQHPTSSPYLNMELGRDKQVKWEIVRAGTSPSLQHTKHHLFLTTDHYGSDRWQMVMNLHCCWMVLEAACLGHQRSAKFPDMHHPPHFTREWYYHRIYVWAYSSNRCRLYWQLLLHLTGYNIMIKKKSHCPHWIQNNNSLMEHRQIKQSN